MLFRHSLFLGLLIYLSGLPIQNALAYETLDGSARSWANMPIRYTINSLSPDLDANAQRTALRNAFAAWANVPNANISFTEGTGKTAATSACRRSASVT